MAINLKKFTNDLVVSFHRHTEGFDFGEMDTDIQLALLTAIVEAATNQIDAESPTASDATDTELTRGQKAARTRRKNAAKRKSNGSDAANTVSHDLTTA